MNLLIERKLSLSISKFIFIYIMIIIQVLFICEWGDFLGKKSKMTEENYIKLIEISRDFYKSEGFELSCEDGSFLVVPPDIVKKSILVIKKVKDIE